MPQVMWSDQTLLSSWHSVGLGSLLGPGATSLDPPRLGVARGQLERRIGSDGDNHITNIYTVFYLFSPHDIGSLDLFCWRQEWLTCVWVPGMPGPCLLRLSGTQRRDCEGPRPGPVTDPLTALETRAPTLHLIHGYYYYFNCQNVGGTFWTPRPPGNPILPLKYVCVTSLSPGPMTVPSHSLILIRQFPSFWTNS